jgi:hypothetical protein
MAGLVLNAGVRAGAGGNYTPLTPAAASAPTAASGSIARSAYGITGSGVDTERPIAGVGSVAVGIVAIAAMVYLWWSLPR